MGQRHQVWVIAKIVPYRKTKPKYRCIAGYHNQWCYGVSPLRAAARAMSLFARKENADVVREEIRALHGEYGRFRQKPDLPSHPCPFTEFLLCSSWDVDLTYERYGYPAIDGCTHEGCLMEANMGCWDGDNDDGITVIDVTDPENPAYCFVLDNKALSGPEYVFPYVEEADSWDLRSLKRIVPIVTEELKGKRLLSNDALAEAWPERWYKSWWERQRKRTYGEFFDIAYDYDEGEEAGEDEEEERRKPIKTIISLVDASLSKAVSEAIKTGNTDTLEAMAWLPGRAESMRKVLQEYSPFPNEGTSLLATVIQCESTQGTASTLDLSNWDLTDEQVILLTRNASMVTTLNLSQLSRITITTVRHVLTQLPVLKRLLLVNCHGVTSDKMVKLVSCEPQLFHKLEALIHPAFFQHSDNTLWTPAITVLNFSDGDRYGGCSLPFLSASGIVQGLLDICPAILRKGPQFVDFCLSSGINAAFTTPARSQDESWRDRCIVAAPVLHRNFRNTTPGTEQWLLVFLVKEPTPWEEDVHPSWAFIRLLASLPQDFVARQATPEADSCSQVDSSSTDGSESEEIPGPRALVRFEIYDLRGFLRIMAEQGRPTASDEAVARAEELLQTLATKGIRDEDDDCRTTRCPLMTREIALELFKQLKIAVEHPIDLAAENTDTSRDENGGVQEGPREEVVAQTQKCEEHKENNVSEKAGGEDGKDLREKHGEIQNERVDSDSDKNDKNDSMCNDAEESSEDGENPVAAKVNSKAGSVDEDNGTDTGSGAGDKDTAHEDPQTILDQLEARRARIEAEREEERAREARRGLLYDMYGIARRTNWTKLHDKRKRGSSCPL